MSFFDQIKAMIFPDPDAIEEGKIPILADVIRRDEVEMKGYHTWLLTDARDLLLQTLRQEYREASLNGSEWITRLKADGIRGFLIHGSEDILTTQEAMFLMEYLKSRILTLPYRQHSSHQETYLKENKTLVRERYYFKPAASNYEFPINQEYGNILLETETYDNRLMFFKCVVTYYNGFNYAPPKDYEELVITLVS